MYFVCFFIIACWTSASFTRGRKIGVPFDIVEATDRPTDRPTEFRANATYLHGAKQKGSPFEMAEATDRSTDGPTDRRTDGPTDRPTDWDPTHPS